MFKCKILQDTGHRIYVFLPPQYCYFFLQNRRKFIQPKFIPKEVCCFGICSCSNVIYKCVYHITWCLINSTFISFKSWARASPKCTKHLNSYTCLPCSNDLINLNLRVKCIYTKQVLFMFHKYPSFISSFSGTTLAYLGLWWFWRLSW